MKTGRFAFLTVANGVAACLMIAASLAFASHIVAGQAMGMLLHNLGAAVMNITLSLYIMDHIRRSDLARSEPERVRA